MEARIKNTGLSLPGALEHRYLDRQGESWRVLRVGIAGDEARLLYRQRFAGLFGVEA